MYNFRSISGLSFSALLCVTFLFAFIARLFSIRKTSRRAEGLSVGWRSVPQPLTVPLLGNPFSINIMRPVSSLFGLAQHYPDCFRLELPGSPLVVVNSHKLVNAVCNEKVFRKEPLGPLLEARNGTGDGLFTAYTHEENWEIAHRLLMPRLGHDAVKGMLDDMYDITCQLIAKWSRVGEHESIDLTDDLRRFALDTIALCAFNLRLDSFQSNDIHPVAPAMTYFMDESNRRSICPRFLDNIFFRQRTKKYWHSIGVGQQTSKRAISARGANPTAKNDALNAMLHAKDPKTGRSLSPQAVIYNTMTLLGAGFETTAGTLAFLLILLIQHPRCMARARHEIDTQLCTQPICPADLHRLPYITACIRETLRLYPSAPGFQVKLRPDAHSHGLGEDQYLVKDTDILTVNLLALHRDRAVWGDDAEEFKPDRMMPDAFAKIPRNAWKPFGNGVRSCLGQAFAMQEMQIAVATLLQKLDFALEDPGYRIKFGEALTLQPKGARILVRGRDAEKEDIG